MEAHMQKFLEKFQHLKIQLEEITTATNNFNDDNCIGVGGFGKVYKGEVSHSKGRGMVAIKRLDHASRQGAPEFLKEITMLSDYKHENVISLVGFCCEGGEMILVYELASRGSLDRYLNSPHLTWSQRLKICLDAAKGLRYLHDPRETHRRLIHCDVKSGNILLDDQWNAKVADVGLSIIGSANEQHSLIVTAAAGTVGYIDPVYWMTNTLTKESDVYSFGVVLLEVLCGRLCYTLDNKGHVVKEILTWIKSYEQNMLNDLIFENPNIEPMHQSVIKRFSGIAYQCLKESREDRPEMSEIVTELEITHNNYELFQNEEFIGKWNEQLHEFQQMVKTAEPPLNYKSEDELMFLMSKGVLLNGGKTWFWLNKKGEQCEMTSIAECLGSDAESYLFSSKYNSRFAVGTYTLYPSDVKYTQVRSQFLSPGITYTVNLVFKFKIRKERRCEPISLKYRLQGESESLISYLAYEREDGWWACELYQLTTDHRTVDLQIMFEGFDRYYDNIFLEGIEFQPLENVEHIDDKQLISDSDSDANWEEKLPVDYEDIMKRSKNTLQWTTKEEAYSIICKGFLISDEETKIGIWFSLDKNGKKCHMLSAALIWDWEKKVLSPESRFGEAIRWVYDRYFKIKTEVQSQLVSSETTYACYLVYKLPKNQSRFEAPVAVEDKLCETRDTNWYIYLTSPQIPVIRPKTGQNTHNPLNRPKIKSLPQQRNNGWIEVQIWELRAATTIKMELELSFVDRRNIGGLIIEGIEFRPI
ncbi:putative protein kinase RLK-Pelle-LRR-VIII-1 family [Helianthus annuus]|uniref:Protein kinase domain-containing protein n=1 Tax=Helianthus annuus TaxID=4232 RepID=A0A9K3ELW6_HELAN|nr:uncharacterized protein LOC110899344 [Helianthus annuus]KAF5774394.1 putative protein kinase RLK-Pelle-LRR-VIII-1 family [Helianthus annuus]KAJ0477747.1 putative protein kinase RLK-Pelle-LRR-VIII-1 family [Helianthus annuus]KAJ0482316.1 putative protein kinase RLK-Pelle-LRR-VIII-1 family [Helianthus annuus]KAJ0498579.1 putative protein kinase RLK-Pelle-LRR-VIII-1 family [Helianthus annuus]KAJ0664593.1 putative protein kinase RLK-Pelle-LRR-VIII-1 family [Helianthus annuus]